MGAFSIYEQPQHNLDPNLKRIIVIYSNTFRLLIYRESANLCLHCFAVALHAAT